MRFTEHTAYDVLMKFIKCVESDSGTIYFHKDFWNLISSQFSKSTGFKIKRFYIDDDR